MLGEFDWQTKVSFHYITPCSMQCVSEKTFSADSAVDF